MRHVLFKLLEREPSFAIAVSIIDIFCIHLPVPKPFTPYKMNEAAKLVMFVLLYKTSRDFQELPGTSLPGTSRHDLALLVTT